MQDSWDEDFTFDRQGLIFNRQVLGYKFMADDVNEEPSHRFLAAAIVGVYEAARNRGISCEIMSESKSYDPIMYHRINIRLGGYPVYLYTWRRMNRRVGLANVVLRVDIERNLTVMRLTKFGSLVYDGDPGWEDETQMWQLTADDLKDSEVVSEASRLLGQIVTTCGYWHGADLGGTMPDCETCPHQSLCVVTTRYLIR